MLSSFRRLSWAPRSGRCSRIPAMYEGVRLSSTDSEMEHRNENRSASNTYVISQNMSLPDTPAASAPALASAALRVSKKDSMSSHTSDGTRQHSIAIQASSARRIAAGIRGITAIEYVLVMLLIVGAVGLGVAH